MSYKIQISKLQRDLLNAALAQVRADSLPDPQGPGEAFATREEEFCVLREMFAELPEDDKPDVLHGFNL